VVTTLIITVAMHLLAELLYCKNNWCYQYCMWMWSSLGTYTKIRGSWSCLLKHKRKWTAGRHHSSEPVSILRRLASMMKR